MESQKTQTEPKIKTIEKRFGLVGAPAVIQIDINQTLRKEVDGFVAGSRCDHNCTLEHGGYDCGAASSLNPGLSARTFATGEQIIEAVRIASGGISMFIGENYLSAEMENRLKSSFPLPDELFDEMRKEYANVPVTVNLFGGNPELHPELFGILRELKAGGYSVNLTTTGGRMLWDDKFLNQILDEKTKPDVIALSADDIESIDHLNELLSVPITGVGGLIDPQGNKSGKDGYKSMWMQIPQSHGQKRKAAEAIFAARISQEIEDFPKLLFNIVVHKGNLGFIEELIDAYRTHFPNVTINPYFAQSSFSDGQPMFEETDLDAIGKFVERRVVEHFDPDVNLSRKVHFWLWYSSAYEAHRYSDPERLIKLLSGEFWKCYNQPGSNRSLQIGNFPGVHQDVTEAPLAPNCFWNNETVLLPTQVTELQPTDIRDYLDGGMSKIAKEKDDPCKGCAMPRLVHDLPNMLLGIDLEDEANREIMKVFLEKLQKVMNV